jgi:hypothetical protein|tara:strand:- start:5980 stop:6555 length:576 start_codon:yes stop_codon:yes gene_type:complete
MVDTVRTKADLVSNLFQDGQAANNITANDVRDLIVSLQPSFGECSMQGNSSATTISGAGTYVKINGTTALSGNELLFDNNSTNTGRLRYIGAPNRVVMFSASCSVSAASNNQVLSFKGWHYDTSGSSGALIDESLVSRKVTASGELGAVVVQGSALLSVNDYLEIHVTNETSTAAVTVADFNFQATALPTV